MTQQLAAALRTIDGELRNDPIAFGDPSYQLRHLGLLKCMGSVQPLYVYYAVDEQRRIVYVTEFRPAPGSALATASETPDGGE